MNKKPRTMMLRRKAYNHARNEVVSVFIKSGEGAISKEVVLNADGQLLKATKFEEYKNICKRYSEKINLDFEERFKRKDIFYCLVNQAEIVSTGWISTTTVFCIAEVDILIQKNDNKSIYILYDFETKPNYRGRGYYPILLTKMTENYGINKEYMIYAVTCNLASIHGIQKAGFYHAGDISYEVKNCKHIFEQMGIANIGRHFRFWGIYYKKDDKDK